jgi:hypothetical protein
MAWTKITKSVADEGFLEGTGFLFGGGFLNTEFAWTKLSKVDDIVAGWGLDRWGLGPYGSPDTGSEWTKITKADSTEGFLEGAGFLAGDGFLDVDDGTWTKLTKATP